MCLEGSQDENKCLFSTIWNFLTKQTKLTVKYIRNFNIFWLNLSRILRKKDIEVTLMG